MRHIICLSGKAKVGVLPNLPAEPVFAPHQQARDRTLGIYRWTLCPLGGLQHPDTALRVDTSVWQSLSKVHKNLWFIDEVEARWQRLLATHPQLPHLTVRWCDSRQLQDSHAAIARFVGAFGGVGEVAAVRCPHHAHGRANLSESVLAAADRIYHQRMNYTAAQLWLISQVQRPNDCATASQCKQSVVAGAARWMDGVCE